MCSIDSGPWCWDATTQAASDDTPSQRRGWRGVLSFSFEVGMHQGRVTLPSKSLWGVRAPNTPSLSNRGNIRHLPRLFRTIQARAVRLGIFFSIPKSELIHWRTPSQRHSHVCLSSIQLDGELLHPRDSLRWLGYWFTRALATSTHFSRRMALAQGAFALIRRLSPSMAGLAPSLCHRLASSLIAPILLCGADLFTPNAASLSRLNTFWQKVQRWATNCFSSTPIGILAI